MSIGQHMRLGTAWRSDVISLLKRAAAEVESEWELKMIADCLVVLLAEDAGATTTTPDPRGTPAKPGEPTSA